MSPRACDGRYCAGPLRAPRSARTAAPLCSALTAACPALTAACSALTAACPALLPLTEDPTARTGEAADQENADSTKEAHPQHDRCDPALSPLWPGFWNLNFQREGEF